MIAPGMCATRPELMGAFGLAASTRWLAAEAEAARGRERTLRLCAERRLVPVAASFGRRDLFPKVRPLCAGDMGLANPRRRRPISPLSRARDRATT